MFRKRDEIDSTSRYHPPPRGGCRLGFGGQTLTIKDTVKQYYYYYYYY